MPDSRTGKINRVHIRLDTMNAAFDPDPGPQVARILRDLADRIDARGLSSLDNHRPMDENGNRVGECWLTLGS